MTGFHRQTTVMAFLMQTQTDKQWRQHILGEQSQTDDSDVGEWEVGMAGG